MVFSGTMSRRSPPGLMLALAACAGGPPTAATSEPAPQSNATDTLAPSETATISTELASRYQGMRVAGLDDRRFNHETYWRAVAPYLGGNVHAAPVGRSVEGREIRQLTFGSGPTTVLLWEPLSGVGERWPASEILGFCVNCVGERRWVTTQSLAQFVSEPL